LAAGPALGDPNGNQTAGVGRSISYTSYNKPASMSTLFFSHDVDHQRFMQQAPEGTTLYFDAFGVHAELFSSGTSSWYDYLSTGGAMLGMRVLSGSTVTTRYFHTDNLGSIAVLTDTSGNVVERDGYDAWGKRRFPSGADDPTDSLTSQTTRGFTAQEELHDVGLVHLNGRVYDPLIARMTSADPMVPDPMNGQAWNRYSYVINNPLAFTDPSGYCFLGLCGFGNAFSGFFNNIFHDIGRSLRQTPILGTIAEIGAVALCGGPQAVVCGIAAAFLSTTAVAGLTSGHLAVGLQAGIVAAVTAAEFYAVGNLTDAISGAQVGTHTPPNLDTDAGFQAYLFNVTAHAAVGCGAAAASGGKCGPSALAGGVTSAAGPAIIQLNFYAGVVASAAIGGGAAVLGGGKFENGAITGAFGYLFNATAGRLAGQWAGGIAGGLLGFESGPLDFAVIMGTPGSVV
jgi:RHS repeat-associated protein